jgi:CHRD domain
MRQRRIQLAAAVAVVAIASVVATTAVAGGGQNAKAKLSGFEEVPAVLSDGSGKFKAEISRTEQRIDYTLSYEGLEGGGVLAAHIHIGQRLANGGITAFLCGGGGKPPCPPSGTVTGTITPANVMPVATQGVLTFDDLVEAIREDITYVNVHTMRSPGGEIRGQIGGGDGDDD